MALGHSTQGRSEAASRETNGQPGVVLLQAGDIKTGKLRRRSSGRRAQEVRWRMALVFFASWFSSSIAGNMSIHEPQTSLDFR
jgi:hypothetical protein